MPAYVRRFLSDFIEADVAEIVGQLEIQYAKDGYATQFVQQTKAWYEALPLLQSELRELQQRLPRSSKWGILLEYPLYRLRRRIDAVILTESAVVVVEMKVGMSRFTSEDERQAEEYALDLRDFHAESRSRPLHPVLWCTAAETGSLRYDRSAEQVARVHRVGATRFAELLETIPTGENSNPLVAEDWDNAPYRPVPNVIEAATAIFAKHKVDNLLRKDASNLQEAAARLVELIRTARQEGRRALMFLTGVPGSGKTLAGLQVVHDAVMTGAEQEGDIIYLSGNTPLVTVLREALALDEHARDKQKPPQPLRDIRLKVRARVQHINDFLKESLKAQSDRPPPEHAIVFDEAQRAWDATQGKKKFDRSASEPSLLLEVMGRHPDWCACVCLVGGGQEINAGEQGVQGWGEALRLLPFPIAERWTIHAPADVLRGGPSTGGLCLGEVPSGMTVREESELQLLVPQRSFRSPRVSEWVDSVLRGDSAAALVTAKDLGQYPIVVTRSLEEARMWLRSNGRGKRRFGLVASSGARRLRADGLGEFLTAADKHEIAHWYLRSENDIRSSYALEVPANEYTCQGLELDFVGVCWGGDFIFTEDGRCAYRRLNGSRWQNVNDATHRQFIRNSYRVLLTRAREGLVLWVPRGDPSDTTRDPVALDATATFLRQCGARFLPGDEVATF
jgi:Schlafen group 3, DNA/RNA helicase domain